MFATFFSNLEHTAFATEIAQNPWLFPTIESFHVLALAVVFGSISIVDLRLLNVSLRHREVTELTKEILPWTWVAFVFAVITGTLLFSSAATKYIHLLPFQLKMIIMACAGINMIFFHVFIERNASRHLSPSLSVQARAAGAISLTFWIAIVTCGRWIGFL